MAIINSPNVETRGEFAQSGTAIFFFYFPDIDGNLFDPSDISIDVFDPAGDPVLEDQDVEALEGHQYVFQWVIPEDADTGLYTIQVSYVVESSSGPSTESFTEEFVVTTKSVSYLQPEAVAAVSFLEMFLGTAQRIGIFNQIGRVNPDRRTVQFHFPRWNQPAGARIYLNGEQTTFDYEVDWLKGKVTFGNKISQYDEVTADYNFRWFKFEELAQFIDQAVQIFNQYPPHSMYNIFNIEARYGITVVSQAAVFALRRLVLDLNFQEPVKVFGGAQRADQVAQRLMGLKENYEKDLSELYKQKALGPYVGLTWSIITPEFTLPGSRSRWFRMLFKN